MEIIGIGGGGTGHLHLQAGLGGIGELDHHVAVYDIGVVDDGPAVLLDLGTGGHGHEHVAQRSRSTGQGHGLVINVDLLHHHLVHVDGFLCVLLLGGLAGAASHKGQGQAQGQGQREQLLQTLHRLTPHFLDFPQTAGRGD